MKRTIITLSVLAALLVSFSLAPLTAAPKEHDLKKIVKKIDDLYRSNSSVTTMEMEIITPHWKRTLKMNGWSMGMEHTFIRILSPKKERGIATLKKGTEMWNFLPKTDKVMKIPPSMMMGSWMGSDFTNDDLVKEFTFIQDYQYQLTQVKNPEPGQVYVKCTPKEGLPIVWGHIIIASRDTDYMPLWQKYYDEKGKLMRQMTFKDVKTFGKKSIPSIMELVPLNKEGHKTVVRYLEAEFDGKVDKNTFSLRNLRTRL